MARMSTLFVVLWLEMTDLSLNLQLFNLFYILTLKMTYLSLNLQWFYILKLKMTKSTVILHFETDNLILYQSIAQLIIKSLQNTAKPNND